MDAKDVSFLAYVKIHTKTLAHLHSLSFKLGYYRRHDWHGQVKFVCVEVLRPSQPNGVMSSAVSLPNHTFTGQA